MKINSILKKILIISLLTIIVFSNLNLYAINLKSQKITIYQDEYIPSIFKEKGKTMGCATVYGKFNGKTYPAYCINMERPGVGSIGIFKQDVLLKEELKDSKAFKAVINGFPYKSAKELGVKNNAEAYIATKFAVWAMQNNLSSKHFTSDGSAKGDRVYKAYTSIMKNAKADLREPGKSDLKITEKSNWIVKDNKFLEKEYNVSAKRKGSIKVSLEKAKFAKILDLSGKEKFNFNIRDNFKIRIPIQKLNEEKEILLKVNASFKTFPVIFAKTSDKKLQNYAFSGIYEDKYENISRSIKLKNDTKIIISKKDPKKKIPIEGVEFEIKEEGKEDKIKLLTDKNGKIILENLNPGKYIIKETKAKDGYIRYEDDIIVEVKFNETKEIEVENTETTKEKKIESEKIKKIYSKMPKTGF